jgi:hypothetical protein
MRHDQSVLYMMLRQLALPAEEVAQAFTPICDQLGERLSPMVRRAAEAQASLLGIDPAVVGRRTEAFDPPEYDGAVSPWHIPVANGEIFVADGELYILTAQSEIGGIYDSPKSAVVRGVAIRITAVSSRADFKHLPFVETVAAEILGRHLEEYTFTARKFDQLKKEMTAQPWNPSSQDLEAAQVLADKSTRKMALAIKASMGGLMLEGLDKQLPGETVETVTRSQAALIDSGLIESEIVVICKRSSNQIVRVSSRDTIARMTQEGMRCACGKPLADERQESALAVTELGPQPPRQESLDVSNCG